MLTFSGATYIRRQSMKEVDAVIQDIYSLRPSITAYNIYRQAAIHVASLLAPPTPPAKRRHSYTQHIEKNAIRRQVSICHTHPTRTRARFSIRLPTPSTAAISNSCSKRGPRNEERPRDVIAERHYFEPKISRPTHQHRHLLHANQLTG